MSKSILITGSTDGIGKLAAIKLAKAGHEIYLHGRNPEKLSQVVTEVKSISKNEKVKGFLADLSDLDAVNTMVEQVNNEVPKIDVLINNAGVFKSPNSPTKAGLDLRLTVNYLAPYLMTNKLLPLIKKASSPRIINLSSAAQDTVSLAALAGKKQIDARASYGQSKLAITMWSFHLAKLEPSISVIAVNPGSLLNTNMVREAYGNFWSPAEKGGNILYDLSVSETYEGITAKYFDNDKGEIKGEFGDAHSDAYDDNMIQQLIDETDHVLNDWIA